MGRQHQRCGRSPLSVLLFWDEGHYEERHLLEALWMFDSSQERYLIESMNFKESEERSRKLTKPNFWDIRT